MYSSGTSIVSSSTGSCTLPSISRIDDLRLADGELETLAPHRLDEHRELQLAAALHLPRVGSLGREHAQRHVADELLLQPALDLARGELLAVLARERGRVDADGHREARLVDRSTGSGRGSSTSASVSPIVISGMPATAMMSPGPASLGGDAVERLREVQLGDLHALDRCRRCGTTRPAGPCGSCRCARGRSRAARRTATRRGW